MVVLTRRSATPACGAVRYAIAIAAVAAAALLRVAAAPLLEHSLPFLTFAFAVAVSAWYGGTGPGIAATGLSVLAAYLFVPPDALSSPAILTGTALFGFLGTGVSLLAGRWRRAVERAAEAENTLSALLEGASQAVVAVDQKGSVVLFNAVAESLFGYSRAEVLGRAVEMLLPEAVRAGHVGKRQAAAQAANMRLTGDGLDLRGRRKNGSLFAADISLSSALIKGSRITAAFVTDISERRAAEEELRASEARYRAFFELAAAGTAQVDAATGRYVNVNRRFCEMTGYTREELLLKSPADITYVEDRDRDVEAHESLRASAIPYYNHEKRYVRKDGRLLWVHVDIAAVRDSSGRMVQSLGIIQDITERKLAEQTIVATNEALRRSNEDLEQFAWSASHDMQEPLRMVILYTQLLERRYKDQLGSDARTYIEFAVTGAERMQRLLSDVLNYARVARLSAEPSCAVDTGAVLRRVIQNLAPLIEAAGARIDYGPLPAVEGHGAHLEQLFFHLVSNAVKYRSEEAPRIRISAERYQSQWLFSVRDNGQGIDPAYQQRVFGLFKRLHGRDYPGTGIGLAICQRIVELYGGRIWLDSYPGRGSTFFFTLPAARVESELAKVN